MKSLTFNGIRKPWLYLTRGRTKPPFASVRRNLLTVPGMPGAHLQSSDVQPLPINQPVGFVINDDEHALELKDELAAWLITDEPVELEFDDEPGRTYFAVVQNTMEDFEKFAELRQGTIQFLCLDPYGYGPELTATFPSDAVTLTNEGTAKAKPIFEIVPNKSLTHIDIVNGDGEYMRVGEPYEIESTPFEPEELILHDTMNTVTGWGQATYVDNGHLSGEMVSDGASFYPSAYGTAIDPPSWQGPSLKKSLPETLQDFRAEILVEQNNVDYENGMLEIYLLDAANNTVAKIGIEDRWASTNKNVGKFQLGPIDDRHNVSEEPNFDKYWNNFDGILKIERIGNVWRPYWAIILPDGTHQHVRSTVKYIDGLGKYAAPIAQIQIAMRKWPTTVATDQRVKDIKVYKINQQPDAIPYLFHANDQVIFDHVTEDILLNGASIKKEIDFGASFFKLKPGQNQLFTFPENSLNVTAKWRPAYK